MKSIARHIYSTFFVAALVLSGCQLLGEDNTAPVANAGNDITVDVSSTVTLSGLHSEDADGDDLAYEWTVVSVPTGSAAALDNALIATPKFVPDMAGTYVFELTVSDGEYSNTDRVTITAQLAMVYLTDVSTDLHLVNIFTSPDQTDYFVEDVIYISANLTIDPGVKITVATGGRFDVEPSGSITAVGKADSMIVFTGENKVAACWDGIAFDSNNPQNQMDYVRVEYAGHNSYAGVYLAYGAQLSMSNCELVDNSTYGLDACEGAVLSTFADNSFARNGIAPVTMYASLIGQLDGGSAYAGENGRDVIEVRASTISSAQTWHKLDVPYVMESVVTIEAAVTVQPGVTCLFESGGRIDVSSNGSLNAVGTATDSIRFAGRVSAAGWWSGIDIQSNDPANEFSYVVFEDGGLNSYSNLYVGGTAEASVTHCAFRMTSRYGVELEEGASLAAFSDNSFAAFARGPVALYANQVGYLDDASDYSSGYGGAYIDVSGSTVTVTQSWSALNVPYRVTGSIYVDAALVIEPGAEFRFRAGAFLDVDQTGSLNAVGAIGDTIRFIGEVANDGYWSGVVIQSNDTANQLSYVEIADGGYNTYANLYVDGSAEATITHSALRRSSTYGIVVDQSGSVTQSDNTFEDNLLGDISIQ